MDIEKLQHLVTNMSQTCHNYVTLQQYCQQFTLSFALLCIVVTIYYIKGNFEVIEMFRERINIYIDMEIKTENGYENDK